MAIITKAELLDLARSANPADRQRAFDIFQAWLAAAPKLAPQQRLQETERIILMQMFKNQK